MIKKSYFSTKTYVVGTQKNRLNETVLLSTQNTCKNWWVRKYSQLYANIFCLSRPLVNDNLFLLFLEPENADIIKELTMLLGKIDEMKTQRTSLEEQLRKDIHEDDITNVLVTREGVNREVRYWKVRNYSAKKVITQRASLEEQLRKDIHEDDITNVLVTREGVNREVSY